MKKKLKRLGLGVLAIVLGAVALLNVMAYNHAYAMLHFVQAGERTANIEQLGLFDKAAVLFHGVNIPRPHARIANSELAKEFELVTIPCADGVRLGALYGVEKASLSTVLLFHGYAAEKTSLLDHARAFRRLGYSVLLVDFRGSGASSEAYTTIGYIEGKDVAAAVAYAKSRQPESRLVLYGISMGAATVLRAVFAEDVHPDAIILESVFDTLLNTTQNRFESMGLPAFPGPQLLVAWGSVQFRFNGFAHNPTHYAASVKCPVLFLHGTADRRARLADARRVFEAVPGHKYFVEFTGGHHESYLRSFPDEWMRAVTDFLDTAHVVPSG